MVHELLLANVFLLFARLLFDRKSDQLIRRGVASTAWKLICEVFDTPDERRHFLEHAPLEVRAIGAISAADSARTGRTF